MPVNWEVGRPTPASSKHWSVLSVGIDWITVTATDHSVRRDLRKAAERLLDAEQDGENIRRGWRWKGYDGWQVGSVVAAERKDSYFCQVSGHAASTYWLALLVGPVNVTRLDLQVTARCPHRKWDEARAQWERMESDETVGRRAGWRSWITTRPSGSTLYIGSPKSDRRLRLYDKHAEQPNAYPPGAWRYEVQARAGLAGSIAASLDSGGGSALTCGATVHKCFSARGVLPRFRADCGGVLGHVPRARSDNERALRWIDGQVAPTVRRLVADGYGDTLRSLLDLG